MENSTETNAVKGSKFLREVYDRLGTKYSVAEIDEFMKLPLVKNTSQKDGMELKEEIDANIKKYSEIFKLTNNSDQIKAIAEEFGTKIAEVKDRFNKKEEFKVGDIVVGWHSAFTDYHNNPWEIRKIDSDNFVYPKGDRYDRATGIEDIRKATSEEIEEFNKKENEHKTELEKVIIGINDARKALEKLEAVTLKLKQNK
jgi:hypothetical protein